MDNTKTITHISLCTGYAGIDIGLSRAIKNFRTIAYSDIEGYAIANLIAKIESGFLDVAPIWTDLKTFPYSEFYKKVDILSAGFPCQPFSHAGERKGTNDERHLFPYIRKGVELCRPAFVFFENVIGIISSKLSNDNSTIDKNTSVLLHVCREMERIDYECTFGIFSARECGAPHIRKRVFILCRDKRISNHHKQEYKKYINESIESKTIYPSFKNEKQKFFEPSRVVYSDEINLQNDVFIANGDKKKNKRQKANVYRFRKCRIFNRLFKKMAFESALARDDNGSSYRLDTSDKHKDYTNRKEEIKLLGNAVVPDTATKAFLILFNKLS